MDTTLYFGEWLQKRRKALDLTQAELARRVGCAVSTIRKIESGERRPSQQIAHLLAESLEIPAEERQRFVKYARGERSSIQLDPLPGSLAQPVPEQGGPTRSYVPAPITPLFGREFEFAESMNLLQNAQCRLLTIVGPGGIGKTRLAIQIAGDASQNLSNAFPDGIFFIPLASISSGELVAPVIAEALGIAFFGQEDPAAQLVRTLRDKSMLMALDNLEHLISADQEGHLGTEIGELLSKILQEAPQVKLLATSRERLNLHGEWILELHGLPIPVLSAESPLTLEAALEYSAVILFLNSARRLAADFELTGENLPDVIRICQSVDGLPLGIELAAAWVRYLSSREIAHEIERNLDFLTVTARGIPARHRSLRAVFEHSWKLLLDQERAVLRRLGIFWGGFTRSAAAFVAGADLAVLTALVDKSLLRRTADGRYDLHEIIRQHVVDYLLEDAQEHALILEHHSRYYLDWLESQNQQLKGENQAASATAISLDIENVRQAWIWAALHQQAELLGKAIPALYRFHDIRGWYQDAIVLFRQASEALRPSETGEKLTVERQAVLGHALATEGYFCLRSGRLEKARELLEESLTWLRPLEGHTQPLAQSALVDVLAHMRLCLHHSADTVQPEKMRHESLDIH